MDNKTPKAPSIWILVISILAVIFLWVSNFWIAAHYTYEARGTFGDTFGAVNALFTGLAFAGVIYGLYAQRHEVKLLETELERSKNIVQQQQELASVQIDAQKKQQFETTFSNFLRVFNDLVNSYSYKESLGPKDGVKPTRRGREVFPKFLTEIISEGRKYQVVSDGTEFTAPEESPAPVQPCSETIYSEFYKANAHQLGQYFRTLYNIFKLVDRSGLDSSEKRVYTNFVRAQLSDAEAMLLFLNGLSEKGEKFKPYLERYSVLKNVDRNHELFRRSEKWDTYSDAAFG